MPVTHIIFLVTLCGLEMMMMTPINKISDYIFCAPYFLETLSHAYFNITFIVMYCTSSCSILMV